MHCITNDNLDKWINIIIRCNVMELDLEYLPERFELFSCTTLVILKLNLLEYDDGAERVHCFAALELPESVYLPRLKSLHLESLMFRRTEFMEKLFLSCPVLETLVIINCELDRRYGVVICSGQLKHLEIERLYAYSYCNGKITVSAPNLETLRCKVDVLNEYGMENLSALVKADIGMEERYIKVLSKVWKRKYAKEMIKFLGALSNAKFLSLSALLLEVLGYFIMLYVEKDFSRPTVDGVICIDSVGAVQQALDKD
ncbi:hypothetical protein IFM89_005715 [Coptis chinensis]|uniref:F-box/LRR-repeat protein 15/At3g58940/PEG3-like LRR domain-containing protein n=1 Tax=Coptis chinensis TaxID=261450 RepID=A0A835IA73_9MAGN|nr:hypothetical protein IFM89_005715 [Coptis chinensis]